jgi:UDP-N-acetylglucosamine--N-acetylmuramyl-(pentapeptide) pyrophosphoryl-undecaprenol N-acetylglucosamine transferase
VTTLLVASGGGHLKQLVELAPRLQGVDAEYRWVTWDSPQSRSLLNGQKVTWVRPTRPRDPVGVSRNFDFAIRLWRDAKASALVTTGSQIVLPFFLVGRALGRPCHFIESAARSQGPSLTGQMSTFIPGMCLYAQYRGWHDRRWKYVGSVFDGFEVVERPDAREHPPSKFVVTLGTLPRWEFRRLVDACMRVIPDGSEVLWQAGATDVRDLGIDAREAIPAHELEHATAAADVVISHAGVGSALTALWCGKRPILLPREASLGEHVDDHQREIAEELGGRGLALVRTPETLTYADLLEAGRVAVIVPDALPPMKLEAGPRSFTQSWRRR